MLVKASLHGLRIAPAVVLLRAAVGQSPADPAAEADGSGGQIQLGHATAARPAGMGEGAEKPPPPAARAHPGIVQRDSLRHRFLTPEIGDVVAEKRRRPVPVSPKDVFDSEWRKGHAFLPQTDDGRCVVIPDKIVPGKLVDIQREALFNRRAPHGQLHLSGIPESSPEKTPIFKPANTSITPSRLQKIIQEMQGSEASNRWWESGGKGR